MITYERIITIMGHVAHTPTLRAVCGAGDSAKKNVMGRFLISYWQPIVPNHSELACRTHRAL